MRLIVCTDPEAIVALVEPLLAAEPVRNTVFSSVIDGLRGPDADGWCAHPAGDPSVLAVRSQRHTPVAVTTGWDDVRPLADAVAALSSLAALAGPVDAVRELTAALGERGVEPTSRMAERLFRLDELTEPREVAGAARLAAAAELTQLKQWYEAFMLDVFGRMPDGFDGHRQVEQSAARSLVWLWSDPAGVPRSMAFRHSAAFGVARIGPVYTAMDARGHGYGSAVTAAVTRNVLDEGAVPVLYTDLANPTSNKIYQRLGYYRVEDRAHVGFN